MRAVRAIIAGFGLSVSILATPANAECATCNSYVVLESLISNCFLQRAETEFQRFRNGETAIFVNLQDCAGYEPPQIAGLPNAGLALPDAAFIVDEPLFVCLWNEVSKRVGTPGDPQEYDLVALCP